MSEEEVTHINIPEANLTPVKLITINNIKYRCQQEEEEEEEEARQQSRQSNTPLPSSRQPSRLSQAPAPSRQSNLPPQSRQNTPAPSQSRLSNASQQQQASSPTSFNASHHSIVQSASRASVGPNHSTYEEETHTVSRNEGPSGAGKIQILCFLII